MSNFQSPRNDTNNTNNTIKIDNNNKNNIKTEEEFMYLETDYLPENNLTTEANEPNNYYLPLEYSASRISEATRFNNTTTNSMKFSCSLNSTTGKLLLTDENLNATVGSELNDFESFKSPNNRNRLQTLKNFFVNQTVEVVQQPKESLTNKEKAEYFHGKGFQCRKMGDFVQAIEFYSKALESYPTHFKALFNRGFAYDKLGDYDSAIYDYTKSIRLDPKNAFAYYNRGISYDKKKQFDDAIRDFSVAITLDPKKADFYHNRGFAYRKMRKFSQAICDYTQAISLDCKHFKAYYNRAFCYNRMGRDEESENDYLEALNLQPKNVHVLQQLGTLLERAGDSNKLHEAYAFFSRAIDLNPEFGPAYNGRGLVLEKFGKEEQAVNDFDKAVELECDNPIFLHNCACCFRNLGRYI